MKLENKIKLAGIGLAVLGIATVFLNSNTVWLNPNLATTYRSIGFNPLLMAFPNLISGSILFASGLIVALIGASRIASRSA